MVFQNYQYQKSIKMNFIFMFTLFREMCKLTRANKFADFKDEIKQEIIAK